MRSCRANKRRWRWSRRDNRLAARQRAAQRAVQSQYIARADCCVAVEVVSWRVGWLRQAAEKVIEARHNVRPAGLAVPVHVPRKDVQPEHKIAAGLAVARDRADAGRPLAIERGRS